MGLYTRASLSYLPTYSKGEERIHLFVRRERYSVRHLSHLRQLSLPCLLWCSCVVSAVLWWLQINESLCSIGCFCQAVEIAISMRVLEILSGVVAFLGVGMFCFVFFVSPRYPFILLPRYTSLPVFFLSSDTQTPYYNSKVLTESSHRRDQTPPPAQKLHGRRRRAEPNDGRVGVVRHQDRRGA